MLGLRETHEIGLKASQTNYYTREVADWIGYPLNHEVTINYALTDIDPRNAVAAFSALRKRFAKWARRKKRRGPTFEPTYAFAFENERDGRAFITMNDGDPHNVHVHWEVHIHLACVEQFRHEVWRWVEETVGNIKDEGAILIKPMVAPANGYLLKGARRAACGIYGRGRGYEPQGVINGRRADASRNIGPKVRRAMDRALNKKRQMPSTGPKQRMHLAADRPSAAL